MQINKPKGIKQKTTERKLGSGVNWQVTLHRQGVKEKDRQQHHHPSQVRPVSARLIVSSKVNRYRYLVNNTKILLMTFIRGL